MPAPRLELGFLSFIPNDYGPENASQALQDGIRLFEHAEQLGYDVGWVRVRHFEQFLSSPLPFLTAVGQHTSRIRLGTGVVPMRYEDPIRLAEDAATTECVQSSRRVRDGGCHRAGRRLRCR
jgi:alkanesulfonate monooxygenase SsuD/methylene tetrahydromethanopterin reductase-like flavin-dependent oxidoreductase (luciferase family)